MDIFKAYLFILEEIIEAKLIEKYTD